MRIKQNIPNAITCGNLLCGCLAIVEAFEGNLVWAAYLVGIAAVLDFFDGFAARALKVSSPIGKDLDSLADMVTFGVVPGMIMYKMMIYSMRFHLNDSYGNSPEYLGYFPIIGFFICIFSAIRLAKFNNDTRQTESFIGLPTPANAIFICSIPLIIDQFINDQNLIKIIYNPWLLLIATCLLSFLLVSELPLFALKFKHFKWKANEIRYIFLGLALVLLATLQFVGIPLTIILYILLSIINNLLKKRTA